MKYQAITYTDRGTRKEVNQDAVGCHVLEWDGHAAAIGIVCDGVGGLSCGEAASQDTVRVLLEWFQYEFRQLVYQAENEEAEEDIGTETEDIPRLASIVFMRLNRVIDDQNAKLFQYAMGRRMEMGTTLTAVLVYGEIYMICQIGDSRAYEMSNAGLVQLTEDQSLVQQEVKWGYLTQEEAKSDKRRNVILQSIGSADSIKPVFQWGNMKEDMTFLLSSDGFIHQLREEEIYECLQSSDKSGQWKLRLQELGKRAMQRGEKDNLSAVLLVQQ